ncbi:MAG: single-stranded DNA-binding protein [Erysipelotrichaceae bacterium]|nr:single-stranded DNA-binding protein [Erysipelotrichaceae bacterium]
MINRAVIVGRLTKDIDLKKTQTGLSVATYTVAVNKPKRKGQEGSEADFINCVAWRATADYLANYAQKGTLVGIDGKIQTRNYKSDTGVTIYVTEVLTDSVNILSNGREKNQVNSVNNSLYNDSFEEDFNQVDSEFTINLNSDDLPF